MDGVNVARAPIGEVTQRVHAALRVARPLRATPSSLPATSATAALDPDLLSGSPRATAGRRPAKPSFLESLAAASSPAAMAGPADLRPFGSPAGFGHARYAAAPRTPGVDDVPASSADSDSSRDVADDDDGDNDNSYDEKHRGRRDHFRGSRRTEPGDVAAITALFAELETARPPPRPLMPAATTANNIEDDDNAGYGFGDDDTDDATNTSGSHSNNTSGSDLTPARAVSSPPPLRSAMRAAGPRRGPPKRVRWEPGTASGPSRPATAWRPPPAAASPRGGPEGPHSYARRPDDNDDDDDALPSAAMVSYLARRAQAADPRAAPAPAPAPVPAPVPVPDDVPPWMAALRARRRASLDGGFTAAAPPALLVTAPPQRCAACGIVVNPSARAAAGRPAYHPWCRPPPTPAADGLFIGFDAPGGESTEL